jgi:hypothetical protein
LGHENRRWRFSFFSIDPISFSRSSRRLRFGNDHDHRIGILNGRGRTYEGGMSSTDLSLKWMTLGSADYESGANHFRLSGDRQLLLNPGEPYRLRFREESESFTIFFPRKRADAAWAQLVGCGASLPEFPTVAARSPALLHRHVESLREETRQSEPDGELLIETALACLSKSRILRSDAASSPSASPRFAILRARNCCADLRAPRTIS